MATTKTIQPTGATITIPAFTDQPDARVFSTDVDNITDAVNSTNQALSNLRTNIGSVSGSTVDVFIQNAVNALNAIFPFGSIATATTITGSVTWVDHNYFRFIATKSHNNYIEIDFASNTQHLTARAGTSDAVVTKYDELVLNSDISKHAIGARISILGYTSTPYYTPSDGYVYLFNEGQQADTVFIGERQNVSIGSTQGRYCTFVRKGTALACRYGNASVACFCPLG